MTPGVSQPLKISFATCGKRRSHTPDYLAVTRGGVWLIDVRPEPLIKESDRESFKAGAGKSPTPWRTVEGLA